LLRRPEGPAGRARGEHQLRQPLLQPAHSAARRFFSAERRLISPPEDPAGRRIVRARFTRHGAVQGRRCPELPMVGNGDTAICKEYLPHVAQAVIRAGWDRLWSASGPRARNGAVVSGDARRRRWRWGQNGTEKDLSDVSAIARPPRGTVCRAAVIRSDAYYKQAGPEAEGG